MIFGDRQRNIRNDSNRVARSIAPAANLTGRTRVTAMSFVCLGVGVAMLMSSAAEEPTQSRHGGGGARFTEVTLPASWKAGFTLLPGDSTAVRFTNWLSDTPVARNRILENGSGVALGDVDG